MCKNRFKNMRSSRQEAEAERQSGTARNKGTALPTAELKGLARGSVWLV